jgi:hypothetical protein
MASIGYRGGAAASWTTELFRVRRTPGGWSSPLQLTGTDGKAFSPRYSPTGDRLAFSYLADPAKDSERDLYVAGIGDGGLDDWTQVTSAPGTEQLPSWNPAGTHLMHTSCSGGVWTVEIATQRRTRIGKVSACSAVWSTTDANRAVLDVGGGLSVLTLHNGRAATITPRKVSDRQPDW